MSTSSTFSPRETVSELDKYIIGQDEAKKAVAIALRNRWRRMQLPDRLKEEIVPKNILMVRPHRRRQNRNIPPPGQIGQSAVHQG